MIFWTACIVLFIVVYSVLERMDRRYQRDPHTRRVLDNIEAMRASSAESEGAWDTCTTKP